MKSNALLYAFCFASTAALAGCGGEPLSAAEVEERMREESTENGFDVSFVHAVAKDEPGSFDVVIDRSDPDETDSDETQLCDVTATTAGTRFSCTILRPSVITEAAGILAADYESRNLEMRDFDVRRTGQGLDFAGSVVVVEPISGDWVRGTCAGSQVGQRIRINCE